MSTGNFFLVVLPFSTNSKLSSANSFSLEDSKQVCSTSLMKIQWEKEKLLVTSNLSFSHSVFYHFGEFEKLFLNFTVALTDLYIFLIAFTNLVLTLYKWIQLRLVLKMWLCKEIRFLLH